MYILWSRGSSDLIFPMEIMANDSTLHRAKRDVHRQSDDDGMVMAQLLRADNLEIPEK